MTTRKFNGRSFKLKTEKKENGSNYNIFASIYVDKEKTPSAGTSFKSEGDAQLWFSGFVTNYDHNNKNK